MTVVVCVDIVRLSIPPLSNRSPTLSVISRNEDFERKRRARQDTEAAGAVSAAVDVTVKSPVKSPVKSRWICPSPNLPNNNGLILWQPSLAQAKKQEQAAADRRRGARVSAPLTPLSPNSSASSMSKRRSSGEDTEGAGDTTPELAHAAQR